MAEPLKRLELRLPVSHPIWSLPKGSRSRVAEEWLDVGRRLMKVEESVKAITEKLNSGREMNGQQERKYVEEGFDKNAFLNHFK